MSFIIGLIHNTLHLSENVENNVKCYTSFRSLLKAQLIPYHQLNMSQNPSSDTMSMDERNNSSSLTHEKVTSRKRCPQMSSGKK